MFVSAICEEDDAMSPDSLSDVTTSSNNDDAALLKDILSPRWASNPEEDGDANPTITVVFSDMNAYVEYIQFRWPQNIDEITVTLIDEDDNEVCIWEMQSEFLSRFIYIESLTKQFCI